MSAANSIRPTAIGLAIAAGLAGQVLGASAASAETASPWVDGYNSKVRLIAGMRAGKPVAGVEIQIADGWKTYWRVPGDSGGVPPHFDWAGSQNLTRAEVVYPAPGRMTDPAGDAVGYKGSVVFPVIIAAEDPGKPVRLALALEFGICKDICVPAEAKIELDLPPQPSEVPAALAQALERVPRKASSRRPADPEFRKGAARLDGDKPMLMFEATFASGATGADAFVEAPDGIYVPLPRKTTEARDGKVTFEIDLSSGAEPADLKGKTLTVTLVSSAGQSEASWTID